MFRSLDEKDYSIALKRIERTDLVGVVDLYDESMVLFEQFLRPIFPDIDLAYITQNITKERAKKMDERIFKTLNDLDLEVANSVIVNNHWDLKLYMASREKVLKGILEFEGFEEKLATFRKRCFSLGE